MRGDLDLSTVEVELPSRGGRRSTVLRLSGLDWCRFWLGFVRDFDDGAGFALRVDILLNDPDGLSVEFRIGEHAGCRSCVVKNAEPELAVVISQACPSPDDLLELAH